jgi:hypothetical protein
MLDTYPPQETPVFWMSIVAKCGAGYHHFASVKRCHLVTDRIRLWKQGVRDLVMELCCALHNFRVRLTLCQPRV